MKDTFGKNAKSLRVSKCRFDNQQRSNQSVQLQLDGKSEMCLQREKFHLPQNLQVNFKLKDSAVQSKQFGAGDRKMMQDWTVVGLREAVTRAGNASKKF